MQNDLISRNELLKWIPFWGGDIESMIEYIANMETAYDVEKVVAELEEEIKNVERYGRDYEEKVIEKGAYENAIEIVRNGGKE